MEVKPGYKQTEVGVIPEEWRVVTIRELIEEKFILGHLDGNHGELYPRSHEFKQHGVPYIGANDFEEGNVSFDRCNFLTNERAMRFRKGVAKDGDVLFAHNATVGPVALLRTHEPFVILSTTATYFRCNPEKLSNLYLKGSLQSEHFVRQYQAVMAQSTRFQVPITAQRKLSLVVPPLPEQRAIAEALGDVDGLLGGLDRLIAKKRDLKQAAMEQLLTGQTRLPSFHGDWEDTQVQDVIANFFCGPSPTCQERNIQDASEWGVLKTTAVTKENGWDWTKHKTLPRVFWNKPHLEVRKGDVIVTKAGPRHRVGVTAWVDYVPPRIIVSGKMIGLRPHPDKVVPLMLASAISARQAQVFLDQRTTGMAESQVNFENSALLETPIRIPSIEEQTAIAAVLSDIDTELTTLEQRRKKTRALKQAMMQELLTGKTRLI
jgi:type I restriction enzyme S subunit